MLLWAIVSLSPLEVSKQRPEKYLLQGPRGIPGTGWAIRWDSLQVPASQKFWEWKTSIPLKLFWRPSRVCARLRAESNEVNAAPVTLRRIPAPWEDWQASSYPNARQNDAVLARGDQQSAVGSQRWLGGRTTWHWRKSPIAASSGGGLGRQENCLDIITHFT